MIMNLKNKKLLVTREASSPSKRQRGSGLIEVMVSLLILGVGLLGVLSLQANGLNSGQRAQFTTEANFLAQDMASRILAYGSRGFNNNTGAILGEYDTVSTVGAGAIQDCSAGCTAAVAVTYDQNEWANAFNQTTQTSLPSGRGDVSWDAGTDTYTIIIRWDQDRTGAAGLTCNSNDKSATGNLTCFQLRVSLR